MSVKLFSYGAAEEVTGSRHFLQSDKTFVMVDCGAFQGKRHASYEKNKVWPKEIDTKSIDATILTHAHFDHCGMLPKLIENGYQGSVICTAATRDLASIVLMDSAKIQASDATYLQKRATKQGKTEPINYPPLYNALDVVKTLSTFITLGYERNFQLGSDMAFKFYDAGHILGSGQAFITVTEPNQKPITVLFSGDLGRCNNPLLRDPTIAPTPNYVVMESTYGDRLHENRSELMGHLANVINDTYDRGGKVVIPSFAIERTQDLIYYLHVLTIEGKIPNIPIFIDSPMAINATNVFKIHPECYDDGALDVFTANNKNPFEFDNLFYTQNVEDSKSINDLTDSAIIISANGMCENGRILHHLRNTIEDERNTVLIIGYMGEGTLGRAILDHEPVVNIFGQPYHLNAKVAYLDALSAHADYEEIWHYLSKMEYTKIETLFLVHGEHLAQAYLADFLLKKGIKKVQIVKYGEQYTLT
jgi:metallo-beta-lactamase family protein